MRRIYTDNKETRRAWRRYRLEQVAIDLVEDLADFVFWIYATAVGIGGLGIFWFLVAHNLI